MIFVTLSDYILVLLHFLSFSFFILYILAIMFLYLQVRYIRTYLYVERHWYAYIFMTIVFHNFRCQDHQFTTDDISVYVHLLNVAVNTKLCLGKMDEAMKLGIIHVATYIVLNSSYTLFRDLLP